VSPDDASPRAPAALSPRAAADANAAEAEADLRAAVARGDEEEAALLRALVESSGGLILYHRARDHYGVAFGDIATAKHLAVVVPGVGRHADFVADWLPWAQNLYGATVSTAVVLWKGYDDPPDLAVAALELALDDRRVEASAQRLSAFVSTLPARRDQSVTVVAHSFGSLVAGEALAHHDMVCDDVIVLGSPGIGVETLDELHLRAGHFFAEKAPGDVVAGLGAAGADPASMLFGATRLTTNAAGRPEVVEHSNYFTRGSRALENIGDVVMGRYDRVVTQSATVANAVGNLVATLLKVPALPVGYAARRYRGPGHRVLLIVDRGVHLAATETGGLVRDAIEAATATGGRLLERIRS
jgi:pimeloyl-ACP methyl ester carboxylesterase